MRVASFGNVCVNETMVSARFAFCGQPAAAATAITSRISTHKIARKSFGRHKHLSLPISILLRTKSETPRDFISPKIAREQPSAPLVRMFRGKHDKL